MYVDAELVVSAYKPLRLEEGMLFVKQEEDYFQLYELNSKQQDAEAYMTIYGCPVELQLFETSTTHPYINQLASHDEIGWIDEGEEMYHITLDDINFILRNNMRCQVEVFLYEGIYVPVFDEEKVIIRLIEEEERWTE